MSNREPGEEFTLKLEVAVDDTMIVQFLNSLNTSERVFGDILLERVKQDEQWGGAEHDDRHFPAEWEHYVMKQVALAGDARRIGVDHRMSAPPHFGDDDEHAEEREREWRERMIKVAALAVAAVQSLDRKEKDHG